ncbi:MAG: YrhB domain-containing protein [Kofleriaceae bacterium]|nr:YrhB domain-containing protein [Kofleriaceae bacterium]
MVLWLDSHHEPGPVCTRTSASRSIDSLIRFRVPGSPRRWPREASQPFPRARSREPSRARAQSIVVDAMLTHDEARFIAESHLRATSTHDVVIVDRHTIERRWGWVFFYNTRQFVETGDRDHGLIGNAPLFVDRVDGHLWISGTGFPIEHYLRVYVWARPWRRAWRRFRTMTGR